MTDIDHLARINALENRYIKLEKLVEELITLYNMHGHVKSLSEPDWQLQRVEAKETTMEKEQ